MLFRSRTTVAETGVDVTHINVDIGECGDHVGDCAGRRSENVIGFSKCLAPLQVGVDSSESVVVDDQHGIDIALQTSSTVDGARDLIHSLEEERNGDDADCENAFLLGHPRHNGRATGACATTHTGGDKHHLYIRSEEFFDFRHTLLGGLLTDFRFTARTKTTGGFRAEQHFGCHRQGLEGLSVGIEHHKIHAFYTLTVHIGHGVATATTDTHCNDCRVLGHDFAAVVVFLYQIEVFGFFHIR